MDQTPWLVKEAVEHMDSLILPHFRAWEWGCGGSTVWLARHVSFLVSIDHDVKWLNTVKARLAKWELFNVKLIYAPLDAHKDVYMDVHWGEAHEYADVILPIEDDYLDLILIDGRNRNRCMRNAFPRLKPGGVLVLDDSQREQYQPAVDLIKGWPRWDYEGEWNGPWWTTVWVKPG